MSEREITRRAFLQTGVATGVLGLAPNLGNQANAAPLPAEGARKPKFSCMVTMEDWASGVGTWGELGARYILKRIHDAGFYRVYWRTSGCGQATYPSRITNSVAYFQPYDPVKYPEHPVALQKMFWSKSGSYWNLADWIMHGDQDGKEQYLNFSKLDSVRISRDYAKRLGLEYYLWHEHAEDHGSIGEIGTMGLRHPEWFTRNRDGKRSHCRFSFALEPAKQYRLDWVRELMEYEPDGIFFDFTKSMESTPGLGCTPHFDERGIWYCTYDKRAVEAFKQKTGRDPFRISNDDDEWVRFRAAYLTDFVRRVRGMQRSTYPNVKVGLFGCPSGRDGLCSTDKIIPLADPLRSNLEDHVTWTSEGLIDEFVSAYTNEKDEKNPKRIKAVIADSRSRVEAPCRYLGAQIETYWPKDQKSIMSMVEPAVEAGCEEIVFFESTPLQWNNTWDAAYKVIKQFSA